MLKKSLVIFLITITSCIVIAQEEKAGDELLGTQSYDDFSKAKFCGSSCHVDFYQQWQQSMMSKAYTHEWDEVEYFKLAVPHAEKDEKVADVKAGCNGCHAPISFAVGDVPPPRPEEGSMANESVNCDVCHSITGFKGAEPFNYNYILKIGDVKFGPRGNGDSPEHTIQKNEFLKSDQFCGTCHNEKSPYNVWVKSTQRELREGPYFVEGVVCQDCHMTYAKGTSASMGTEHPDIAQHLFHGAHDPGKVNGTIELRVHPNVNEVLMGETVEFTVALFNQKTGHKFPTGSVEDRILWLHVEAIDANGKVIHLPVDKKGFDGEEYTIGADVLAYQDMGIALDDSDFEGVQRDGIPVGDRIFRMPYFDPEGRMTIQQWNTKSLGVDYRIGPRETKLETFTFSVPYDVAPGELKVKAVLNYQKLVGPVAEFLGVPEEAEIIKVNEHSTTVNVIP